MQSSLFYRDAKLISQTVGKMTVEESETMPSMCDLVRGYFSWTACPALTSQQVTAAWAAELLARTARSPLGRRCPVERGYCARWARRVVEACEMAGAECGAWYELLGELHSAPAAPSRGYRSYFLRQP